MHYIDLGIDTVTRPFQVTQSILHYHSHELSMHRMYPKQDLNAVVGKICIIKLYIICQIEANNTDMS